jgi:hypothetical protein
MTSSIAAQEALEAYLLAKMATLCGETPMGVDLDAFRRMEELALFDIATPFERVASTLGRGTVSPPRVIDDAPESLRLSVEHRYALSRWPSFDFVILESAEGMAWGHAFARRAGMPVPAIRRLADLVRWSHVESEVRAALGAPESHEQWSPWESAVYRLDGRAFALCYVHGLLQNVRPVG